MESACSAGGRGGLAPACPACPASHTHRERLLISRTPPPGHCQHYQPLHACPSQTDDQTWSSSSKKFKLGLTRVSWASWGLASVRARSAQVPEMHRPCCLANCTFKFVPSAWEGNQATAQLPAKRPPARLASPCSHAHPETLDPKTDMLVVTIGTCESQARQHASTHMGPRSSCPPAQASTRTPLHSVCCEVECSPRKNE